jgi:hypothetical protein
MKNQEHKFWHSIEITESALTEEPLPIQKT